MSSTRQELEDLGATGNYAPSSSNYLYAQLLGLVKAALEKSEEIEGIAVCSSQGLPIVDGFAGEHDITAIAAMAEMTRRSGTKVFQNLGYAGPKHLIMHGEDVEIIVWSVNRDASIIALAESGANLGLVQIVLRDLAAELDDLLRL